MRNKKPGNLLYMDLVPQRKAEFCVRKCLVGVGLVVMLMGVASQKGTERGIPEVSWLLKTLGSSKWPDRVSAVQKRSGWACITLCLVSRRAERDVYSECGGKCGVSG